MLPTEKSESISDYYTRTLTLVNQMKANGEIVTDLQVIEKILRTLTIKSEYIVAAIEKSKDLTTMSLDGLMGSLMAHEQRMLEKNAESKCEEALQCQLNFQNEVDTTKNEIKSSKKWQNHKSDKRNGGKPWQDRKKGNETNKKNSKVHIQFFNCKRYGHY